MRGFTLAAFFEAPLRHFTDPLSLGMYMAVAHIVERVSGVRFAEYVRRNIINRLPFKSATYNATEAKLSGHLADGFARVRRNVSSGGLGWSKSVYQPTECFIDSTTEDIVAGPGGLMMSASDVVSQKSPFLWDCHKPCLMPVGRMATNLTVVWKASRDW